ncbi:MAG: hypothetical protein K2X93_26360 [Candidatus Obscuribacterales bacterium]|nr:hypothetical protein [Candidatus Obscuribacterales bacterium]
MRNAFGKAPFRPVCINVLTREALGGVRLADDYGNDLEGARAEVREDLTAAGFTVLLSHHPNVMVARRDGRQFNIILRRHKDDVRAMELASHGDQPLTDNNVWVIQRNLRRVVRDSRVSSNLRRQFERQLRRRVLSGVWAKKIAFAAIQYQIAMTMAEELVGYDMYKMIDREQVELETRLLCATVPGETEVLELGNVLLARLTELQERLSAAQTDARQKVERLEALATNGEGDIGVGALVRDAASSVIALHDLQLREVYGAHTRAIGYDDVSSKMITDGLAETDSLFARIEAALVALKGQTALPWDDNPLTHGSVDSIKSGYGIRLKPTFFDALAPFVRAEEKCDDNWGGQDDRTEPVDLEVVTVGETGGD